MKERPILLTGPEVRAILDGRKAQLRRVVKPQPPGGYDRSAWVSAPVMGWTAQPVPAKDWHQVRSPYGVVGDRLWVREAWRVDVGHDHRAGSDIARPVRVQYEAGSGGGAFPGYRLRRPGRYRHARFMPRWASRLLLEVTAVRVERLQDITEADAVAEGARRFDDLPSSHPYHQDSRWSMGEPTSTAQCLGTARYAFANAWDKALANRRAQWVSNPWVWAVEFRRVTEGAAP